MATPPVALRLNEDTQTRLKALGNRRDRSPHYLMKEAVERYLTTEEAAEAERALMKERWGKYELTGEVVDHKMVKSWASSLPDAPSR